MVSCQETAIQLVDLIADVPASRSIVPPCDKENPQLHDLILGVPPEHARAHTHVHICIIDIPRGLGQ